MGGLGRVAVPARVARVVLALSLWMIPGVGILEAQEMNGQGGEEVRLVREAADREAAGDFAGAEQILRTVLQARPTSVSALLSLERVLRVQDRIGDLLPYVDRFLEEDRASAVGHQMRLRVLSDLDRVEELEEAAESWIEAMPKVETPYREIARIWQSRGAHGRAVEVLKRGRSRLGREDALALELGDAYAALREDERAVREWDRAVGSDGRGFTLVRRRLASSADGGARLLPALIDALVRSPVSTARRRAAAELAIDAGLEGRAEAIARAAAEEMAPAERSSFLIDVARRADGAGLHRLAYWAYSALLAAGGPDEQLLAVRSRLGELALALGDTAAAGEHFLTLEQAYAPGSPERRLATAVRIELAARDGDVEGALDEFALFRQEFPEAAELDGLAASIAAVLLDRRDTVGAEKVLAGVTGPRSGVMRGRIALHNGDIAGARVALLSAAPRLTGPEATETIALATLLGRLSPAGGELLAGAMGRAGAGAVADAVALLADPPEELRREERAAILDYAAGMADRAGLPAESERIRRLIVADYPDTREAPGALLALARALVRRPGGLEEGRAFLERLVLDYPRSALVPQARRELERLRGGAPHS